MSLFDALGGGLAAYLESDALKDQAKSLQRTGEGLQRDILGASQRAQDTLAFKPITVTSGLGRTNIGADGGISTSLSQQGQQLQNTLLGQAQSMAGQAPVTQESLYAQLQAAQAPELQRQRDILEARLRAQGRLGINAGAYGGSPETFEFEKAAQEAQAANFFRAAQLAPQLQGQGIQNIANTLAAGYTPQTQLQSLLSPALTAGQIRQSAQTGQAESLLKGALEAADIRATTESNLAKILAEREQAKAQAYGGLFTAAAPSVLSGANNIVRGLLGETTTINGQAVPDDRGTGEMVLDYLKGLF